MSFTRSSGVLAHPTSFPSKYGIGDLGKGAFDFIDFLYEGGQTLWQVLPLNPTSFGDSPYQSFSTFAGNPLLISLDLLIEEGFLNEKDFLPGGAFEIPDFDPTKINYGETIKYKMKVLRSSYEVFEKKSTVALEKAFAAFCVDNAEWLDSYCLFVAVKNHFIKEREYSYETPEYKSYKKANKKYLTEDQINDYFYGAVWNSWPKDLASYKNTAVSQWTEKLSDEVLFNKYLQFMFFKQWNNLKKYANGKNIKIIGDIPIFVAMDSADVWSGKEKYQLDKNNYPTSVAGVPPDYFSETGQLWGNPLYDWEEHERTGYAWWIKRISHILSLVDIVRIDHFRGFESYWSIPYGEKTAISGEWRKGPGEGLFLQVEGELGSLPIIAEDLGIITDEVTALREKLKLPGMKVLQFGFDAGKNNNNMPHHYNSSDIVVYSGTHDNDTTLGWYKTAAPEIQDQFRRYMNVSGEDCPWDMIRLAFLSVGVYAIAPVQDIMSLDTDDRMNVPGVPGGNWQFRYTEDMLKKEYAERLKYLSKITDRNLLEETEMTETLEESEEPEKTESV